MPTNEYTQTNHTVLTDGILTGIWNLWAFISLISVVVSLFVILVILTDKKIRSKQFNKNIVGLVIPDLIFGTLCGIQCLTNSRHGMYYGGDMFCELQSVYVMSCISASIWMNLLISNEIYNLAKSTKTLNLKIQSSNRIIILQILLVYILCTLLGSLVLLIRFYDNDNTLQHSQGLACLPKAYDSSSSLIFWILYILIVIIVPLVIVAVRLHKTRKILMPSKVSVDCIRPHETSNLKNTSKKIINMFTKLFIILLIMWVPTFLFIFVNHSLPYVTIIMGTWSHVQSFVPAFVYLNKKDIKKRVQYLIYGENVESGVNLTSFLD